MRPCTVRYRAGVLTLSTLFCVGLAAQTRLAFDAVSVKPSAPQSTGPTRLAGGPGTSGSGRISWTNISLMAVLTRAYNVWRYQISGPSAALDPL
jgi:hypothetical protein